MAPTLDTNAAMNQRNCNNKEPVVAPSTKGSFRSMLDGIREAFERPDNKVNEDELWQVLENHQSDPSEWARYAYYDSQKYRRNLVEDHEKYNVMILTWGPNTKSCIHDHSGSHCFMKILDGELIESRYPWPDESRIQRDGKMRPMSESRIGLNDVLYINDKVGLHCVENPSKTKTAASLHVYIPPYRECKSFDPRTGQAFGCELTFYSDRGKILVREDEEN